jgi:tryptophan halogenase
MQTDRNGTLKVVIVGGGTAGWMCAAGMARLLDPKAYEITLIESDEIGTVGVGEATLPHIKTFNDMLGIDEAQFLRETQGTFKLGIEFRDWNRPGDRYIHPFGTFGEPWNGVDFQHHWARAKRRTRGRAAAGLFLRRGRLPGERLRISQPGRQVDPLDLRLRLPFRRGPLCGLPAPLVDGAGRDPGRGHGRPTSPATASGQVRSLTLKSGATIEGDLFIDCTGFPLAAAGRPDEGRVAGLGPVAALRPRPGRALRDRRRWPDALHPGQRRPGRLALAHPAAAPHRQRLRVLQRLPGRGPGARDPAGQAGRPGPGRAALLRFKAGRRVRGWSGNVVAMGLASGFLEPLESTSIFLIQAAVIDLVNLMPTPGEGDRMDPRLVAEFNRLFEIQYDRVRDFLILHYRANSRFGEPLWDHVRTMDIPDSLEAKMELFEAAPPCRTTSTACSRATAGCRCWKGRG